MLASLEERLERQFEEGSISGAAYNKRKLQLAAAGNPMSFGNKVLEDLSVAALGAPAGAKEVVSAVGFDIRDIVTGRDFAPDRSHDLGKLMIEQVREDLRHPLRHPGFTGLDIAAALSGGAGGLTRVEAAGRAAGAASRAGASPLRVVGQALARKPSEGGSLLRRPPPGRVELVPGVHRNLSRNPLAELIQRRHIERMKEGREGLSSMGVPRPLRRKNLAELTGHERRRTEQIVADVERAEAEALKERGRRLSDVESTAVRAVGERTGIDERIAAHRRDLAAVKGKTPSAYLTRRRLRDKIALLEEVKRQGSVEMGEDGVPRFKPGTKLANLYERAVASTGRREAIIEELGLATREQLTARRAAPARIVAGATFERQKAQAPRKAHTRTYQIGERQMERPRTEAEAKSRLAALDKAYEATIEGIVREITGGVHDPSETARRNLHNLRLRGKKKGLTPMRTVKQEVRGMAEDRLAQVLEARKGDPEVARVAALVEERTMLRETLSDPERHFGERQAQTGEFGQVQYTTPEKTITRKFGEREGQPAYERIVGFEETPAGDLYIPYGRRRIKISAAQVGTSQGVGVPRTPQSLTRPFTGRAFQTGRFRDDAVTAIAESELEIIRHNAVLRLREQSERASISAEEVARLPLRDRDHYVPVRLERWRRRGKQGKASGKTITGEQYRALPKDEQRRYVREGAYSPDTKEFIDTIEGKTSEGIRLSRKERKELANRGDKVRKWAFPDMDTQQALASAAKGEVRFVDERTLGGLNKPEAIGGGAFRPLGTVFDEINSAQQIAILFLKPAYLTPNLIGQTALSLIQQGPAAPWNLSKAAGLFRKLTPEDQSKVRAGIGQGFAQSLDARQGRVFTPVRNRMAQAYSKVLDSPFRWPAFYHEAAKLGYDTPQKIKGLLNDAAKRDDMIEVFKRTRDAMIDYSDLTPWEQRLIRRVIFFYPWVKGSTVYTARFVRDRPVLAAGTAQAARVGMEKAERQLGPGPWYGRGTFKVGGTEDQPLVVNPQAAGLFGSGVQAIESVQNLIEGKPKAAGSSITDLLSPAAQLPRQILDPQDPLLGYELPFLEAMKRQYVSNLPQARLIKELREPTEGETDVLYPTSRRGAVTKFGVGTIAPRPMNRDEWQERAADDRKVGLDPAERAYRRVFDERMSFWNAAKDVAPEALKGGRLPEDLREAFNRKAALERERARIDAATEPSTVERELGKFEAEARLLVKWQAITTAQVGTALKWARAATAEEIATERRKLTYKYFSPIYGDRILQARHFLEDQGADLGSY